ncbi:related to TRS31 - TRAPP subunit of 31 kDa involved in targeting and fusion of ER to golgi transport vesicles [Ustilago sp. UG-2017a]|nr:related to TRS31 - TRAPP subunit of 31 kDa involved in targeting and fusion of ER to golgi transport vesicles [Ustilago sp. UG-2017a]
MTSTPRISQRFSTQTTASTSSTSSYPPPPPSQLPDPSSAASYSFAQSNTAIPPPFSSRRTSASVLSSSASSSQQTALISSSASSASQRYSNPSRNASARSASSVIDEGNTSYNSTGAWTRSGPVPDIVERPRDKTRQSEVALSSLSFLFSEIVTYTQNRVTGVTDLEKRLSLIGYTVGQRVLGLAMHRQEMTNNPKNPKRETRLLPALLWIHTGFWKAAFGKAADSLERSTEAGRGDECKFPAAP